MEKIQTLVQAANQTLRSSVPKRSANSVQFSTSKNTGEIVSVKNFDLHNHIAPLVHAKFTSLYQSAWTCKFSTKSERTGIIYPYVLAVAQVGGLKHEGLTKFRRTLKWLASPLNKKHVSFPPNPQEFLVLMTELPETMQAPPRRLSKKVKVTLRARIYSGLCKLLAGASIDSSHAEIKELVLANFELFKKHTAKHGIPIPGTDSAKNYKYFEPILDLEAAK